MPLVVERYRVMSKIEVYKAALEYYGKTAQITQLFEEMAELTKELSKNNRGIDNVDHIAEEIADTLIMLEQMILLFNCSKEVTAWRDFKVERLKYNLTAEGVI